jgi:hypothetical protein
VSDPHGVIWTLADIWRAKGKDKYLQFIAAMMEKMEKADTATITGEVTLIQKGIRDAHTTIKEKAV